jgi:hypothetical protein
MRTAALQTRTALNYNDEGSPSYTTSPDLTAASSPARAAARRFNGSEQPARALVRNLAKATRTRRYACLLALWDRCCAHIEERGTYPGWG